MIAQENRGSRSDALYIAPLVWDLIYQIIFDDQMALLNKEYCELYQWHDGHLTIPMISVDYARDDCDWDHAIDWQGAAYNYRTLSDGSTRTGDPIYHHFFVDTPDYESIVVCCQISVLPNNY